ncbi:MAG: hypothetical protein RDV48_17900 [Candidatus Eremiobacteraeota bacterium]|nr:hypothetical protein [Candidatus Eremiobacteraeota bacterium]
MASETPGNDKNLSYLKRITGSREQQETCGEKEVWNPFWGPPPGDSPAALTVSSEEKVRELERMQTEAAITSLKGGVAAIGSSSEQFVAFPSKAEVIQQVHKLQKELILYRESWSAGEPVERDRDILRKRIMVLMVCIDHFKKCSPSYYKPLDAVIVLLSNMDKVLAPDGTGVILSGTIDVYDLEVKSLYRALQNEKHFQTASKLSGFTGVVLLLLFAALPGLSAYHPELVGGLFLFTSILLSKLNLWIHYTVRT